MKKEKIIKFLLVFFIAGILGGTLFGFMFSFVILSIIYNPILCFIFSAIVFLFFIPSIWKQIKLKRYFVIIRKLFAIFFFGTLLTAMLLLEESMISFNKFDWTVIYICVPLVLIPFTIYLILEEYYNKSWLYKEIQHIIKGMQHYGLLPKEDKEK